MRDTAFFNSRVVCDPEEFKQMADVIIENRCDEDIQDVPNKVYTGDLYFRD